MWEKVAKKASAAFDWLIRRPAWLMLAASDDRLAGEPAARFAHAGFGVLVLSLAWGMISCVLYVAAWRLFGDYNIILIPPMITAAAWALWLDRRSLIALADILGGRDATARATMAALLVTLMTIGLMRLRSNPHLVEYPLPVWLAWGRPNDVLYRVLLLMPLWGGWAMMATCQFCKAGEHTPPAVAAFARSCGAMTTAAVMGLLMAVSILYFTHLPWRQMSISAAAILAAVAGGLAFCRRTGGLTRNALLAANLLTQLVFLLAYLAN